MKKTAFAITLTLSAAASLAADEPAVVGAGGYVCADVQKMTDRDAIAVVAWMQGFISGANIMQASTTGYMWLLPPLEDVATHIDRFCAKNPNLTLYRAGTYLVGALKSGAQRRKL